MDYEQIQGQETFATQQPHTSSPVALGAVRVHPTVT